MTEPTTLLISADSNFIDLFTEEFNGDRWWMARYRGPHADEIIAIMDTDELPTPFSNRVSFEEVRDTLEQLNPNAHVHCRHRNASSTPGVGVIVCHDCGMRW
jgi:hypothetical protein